VHPVRAGQHGANQPDKYDEQDHATATSAAAAATKTKSVLHPIENGVDKKKLEQARKTSGAVIHDTLLLQVTVDSNMEYDLLRILVVEKASTITFRVAFLNKSIIANN
jgi:hypothetical protein